MHVEPELNPFANTTSPAALVQGSLIEARGICKSFRTASQTVIVLQGVYLSIQARESLAILGASGAGKSTLLHILGTLDRPSEGSLTYFGQEPPFRNDQALSRFRNQNIGFVFQFHHLLPEFNALENVMLPSLIGGFARKEAQSRAEALLHRVGLQSRLTHRPGQLSGGEQQRVAIARALMQNPAVLFADEPTGALDRSTGLQVYELLMELNREYGITLVLATHNIELAEKMDRRMVLSDGKMISQK